MLIPSENVSDEARYEALTQKQSLAWEAKCTRCGSCCGVADGDICENLEMRTNGLYACRIYETRFGMRKTLSGRVFQCVPLRWIINQHWPGDHLCGYKK